MVGDNKRRRRGMKTGGRYRQWQEGGGEEGGIRGYNIIRSVIVHVFPSEDGGVTWRPKSRVWFLRSMARELRSIYIRR